MTEEMLGGQHRNDECDTDLGVRGEQTNATLKQLRNGCVSRRPTPQKKALATADLVRETELHRSWHDEWQRYTASKCRVTGIA
jgi:hypothetical protein